VKEGKPWFDSVAVVGAGDQQEEYAQVRALFYMRVGDVEEPMILVRMFRQCSQAQQDESILSRAGNVRLQWVGEEFRKGSDPTSHVFRSNYQILLLAHVRRSVYIVPDFSSDEVQKFFVNKYKCHWAVMLIPRLAFCRHDLGLQITQQLTCKTKLNCQCLSKSGVARLLHLRRHRLEPKHSSSDPGCIHMATWLTSAAASTRLISGLSPDGASRDSAGEPAPQKSPMWSRHVADTRSLKVVYGDKYDKGRMK
jgi:hypothetical protein